MDDEVRMPDGRRTAALRRRLLGWYARHGRELAWRAPRGRRPDPYHVLVSEAMLQQTQAATATPYFHRFIERFPTVADLAAADQQAVLRLWQGLGYYRRARRLHQAARLIVERFAGRVPSTVQELLELPGVGRYTAGAIASIAHGRRAPIVDGNVARVLARWFLIERPVDEPATKRLLWRLADRLVPKPEQASPGDFNQALMDLGATLCTPRKPACRRCPAARLCEARRARRVDQTPRRLPRRPRSAVTHVVLAIRRGPRYFFEQRPANGLWANMWQLATLEPGEHDQQPDLHALGRWAHQRLGLVIDSPRRLSAFTHQTTHRHITMVVYAAQATGGRLRPHRGLWRKLGGLDDLPLAQAQRKAIAILRDPPT